VTSDPDLWTKTLHPHDRRWVLAEERRTGQSGDQFALEYRMFRVGLSGMRERLSLLGGKFELMSEPGAGTTLKAEIELPAQR